MKTPLTQKHQRRWALLLRNKIAEQKHKALEAIETAFL